MWTEGVHIRVTLKFPRVWHSYKSGTMAGHYKLATSWCRSWVELSSSWWSVGPSWEGYYRQITFIFTPLKDILTCFLCQVLNAGDDMVGLEQLEDDADQIALDKARRSVGSMSAMSGANGMVYMEYRYLITNLLPEKFMTYTTDRNEFSFRYFWYIG